VVKVGKVEAISRRLYLCYSYCCIFPTTLCGQITLGDLTIVKKEVFRTCA